MNLARIMGVMVGFLTVLTLAHMISARLAVLLFLLFAASLVKFATREIIATAQPCPLVTPPFVGYLCSPFPNSSRAALTPVARLSAGPLPQ